MDETPDRNIESEHHFQLLLADYQSGREDDRTLLTVQSAGVGVVITLIGLLSAMIMQACTFNPDQKPPECNDLPQLMLAGAPLLPTATAAFLLMLGALSTVRNYYLRAVERQLRQYVDRPFEEMPGTAPGPGMYMTVTTELTSLRRGRLSHRLLARLVVVSASAAFLGITIHIMLNVETQFQYLMIAFYGPLFALVVYEYIAAGLGGRSLFTKAVLAAAARAGKADYLPTVEELQNRSRQRPILSYLIYPRPEDWQKLFNSAALYFPVALLVGDFSRMLDFVVLVLVLELLIYQARYQVSDIRDASTDRLHVESHARGRLPQSGDSAVDREYVHWSLAVMVLRLVTAALIGYYFYPEVFWLLGIIFVVSGCYEYLRAKAPRSLVRKPTVRVVLIWLVAGLGYAVRGALGIALAGVALNTALGAVGIAFYFALGVMFVLIPWVLDAASYCRIDQRDEWVFSPELVAKPHLSVLLSYVQKLDRMQTDVKRIPLVGYGTRERVLAEGKRFWTPWNIIFIVAAGLGGALGALLCTGGEIEVGLALPAAAVGVVSAAMVARSRTGRVRKLVYLVGTGALAAVPYAWASVSDTSVAALGRAPSELVWLVASLPWLMFWVFYVNIVGQSYHDLKYSIQRIIAAVVTGGSLILRMLVGRSTWQALGYRDALDSWQKRLIREPGTHVGEREAEQS